MENMLDFIKSKRSIRRYKKEQIKDSELNQILEAGLWAPNAGSKQFPIFLVSQDEIVNWKLGVINRKLFVNTITDEVNYVSKQQPSIADLSSIKTAFYSAPTVITIFAPDNYLYTKEDCAVAATSMSIMAWSLGIGSCYVSRADETFKTEYGKELMKKAGIDETYTAITHLLLGYPDGEIGEGKPRKYDRIKHI